MNYMQATSLYDVMSLMPGGISQNQDMSSAQQINIRQVSSSSGPEAPSECYGHRNNSSMVPPSQIMLIYLR